MSNSLLVNYTKISPHKSSPRIDGIKKITIHHMAGNLTVEQCGAVFQVHKASANYGIGSDGRVGMYVEEADRSWASSSAANDNQAVTVEVANCGGGPDWPVSDAAYARLIDLCADICRRNGIERLVYTGDTSGNLTMHKWFAATLCPGPFLESLFPDIAAQVNARLACTQTGPSDVVYEEDRDMKDVTQLTDEECYEIVLKAQRHAASLAVPGWAKEKFEAAKQHGITDGTRPAALVTRCEAAIMADRAKGGQTI